MISTERKVSNNFKCMVLFLEPKGPREHVDFAKLFTNNLIDFQALSIAPEHRKKEIKSIQFIILD